MSGQRYLVTARKYRPQVFSELVAQEHVTETVKNAIRLDRLAHAYLFSGPRGVGKTTAARILAKAINCTTPLEEREGNAEPCRQCESCQTFEEGRSLNIIEIDAASNNRVDDIRELRETVRIPPQGGRKKVYIVDEVHMLSAQAFNALLKTLEEPPPHVLFIFATTEPHKVLPTILSRCQRFDFRRIAVPEIVARLNEICEEESLTADEASLMLIARKGDGALRDSLSVFDQAVSLCGSDIRYQELAQALGVVDVDLYFDVTNRVVEQDTAGMLRLVERTVRAGHDLQEFLAGLTEHLRNLLVARAMEDASLIEAAEDMRKRYAKEAVQFEEADLLRLLTLAEDAEERLKGSSQPRLKVETTLLKMASITLAADLREALDKIDRLERLAREGKLSVGGGGTAAAGGTDDGGSSNGGKASTEGGRKAPVNSPAESARSSSAESQESGRTPSDPATAEADSAREQRPKTAADAPPSASMKARRTPPSRPANAAVEAAPSEPAASAGSAATSAPAARPASDILGTPAIKRRGAAKAEHARSDVGPENGHPSEEAHTPSAGPVEQVWSEVLERVKNDKIQVWSLLHHARPESYRDKQAMIAVPNDFHRRVLSSQETYILSHLTPLVSEPLRSLQFVVREEIEASDLKETASEFDPYEYMQRKRQENPVIRAIFDQFGGELVW